MRIFNTWEKEAQTEIQVIAIYIIALNSLEAYLPFNQARLFLQLRGKASLLLLDFSIHCAIFFFIHLCKAYICSI
jgi:hypothetical protein